MARYFFHVRDGDTLARDDEEGEELPNLEAVRLVAIAGARELLSDAARSGKAGSLRQQIEVADESGQTVLIMPVGHGVGTESQT
jgi:hypothetical protein